MIPEFDEPEEICNYTGEICHGNPNYCEECDITEEGSEWDCRNKGA